MGHARKTGTINIREKTCVKQKMSPLKAWLFQNKDFWKPAQVKALLNGVPKKGFILDDYRFKSL